MKRPQDPRHHSKKPEKVFQMEGRIKLADDDSNIDTTPSLEFAVKAWNKALKDHESQGHRIVEGPWLENSSSYSNSGLMLTYTYEWDNLNYSKEKVEWDAMLAIYEHELASWKAYEEDRKKELSAQSVKSIDTQITRTEHRLANLKAVKAGEPLPFPKG